MKYVNELNKFNKEAGKINGKTRNRSIKNFVTSVETYCRKNGCINQFNKAKLITDKTNSYQYKDLNK